MRTTTLKINGSVVTAILCAGAFGAKVYHATGVDGYVVQKGRSVEVVTENQDAYSIVSKFVTLRYQPSEAHQTIISAFQTLVTS